MLMLKIKFISYYDIYSRFTVIIIKLDVSRKYGRATFRKKINEIVENMMKLLGISSGEDREIQ